MKSLIVTGFFLLFSSTALAVRPVHSCSGNLSVERNSSNFLVLRQNSREIGALRIRHQLTGGLFNLENSLLVVYGLPNQANPAHPQTTYLTLYSLDRKRPRMRRLLSEVFGSRILEIGFTEDNKSVYVNTRLGHGLIDIRNKDVAWFSLSEELDVKLQECSAENRARAF